MLDFVFILIFPNDFIFFYIAFTGYFLLWFFWELVNGFFNNFILHLFLSRHLYYLNSCHFSINFYNSYMLFYKVVYI